MDIFERFSFRSLRAAKRLAEEIEVLHNSPLVDPVWYRQTYPDVRDTPIDVARHYLEHGAAEGRNPHPLFDTKFYLEKNLDVAASGMNPLVHYLRFGGKEGRNPHLLFDTKFYLEKNPDVVVSGMNPLAHYVRLGGKEGRNPHPLFDTKYYLAQTAAVLGDELSPLAHYVLYGASKGVKVNPVVEPFEYPEQQIVSYFDVEYYLRLYPDVAKAQVDPLQHFKKIGGLELRNPNEFFDSKWYAFRYPDITSAYPVPLIHYIMHGAREQRDPSPHFDAPFYIRNHPEARDNALAHYLKVGRAAGYEVALRVNVSDYLPSRSRLLEPPAGLDVDVIIPVYRGLKETQVCIQSVLADPDRPAGRLIVVDDYSPEPELSAWLDEMNRTGLLRLLRNDRNIGFVASVNRGMAEAARHDVVLLNSDTEVPKGWLRRMAGHAYSAPMVGTVTPYSNNATICSYPTFGGGELVFGKSLAELDSAAQAANAGRSVAIPTAVGFAMYIRRDCLDAIGPFDQQRFGRGYGEENDFCVRATEAGWVHKLACDVFVYHAGEISFGKNSPERNRAWSRLVELHPDYPAAVASHIERDAGAAYRFALTAKLFSEGRERVTLLISHNLGGGTERYIRECIDLAAGRVHWVLLRPAGRGVSIEVPEIENHPVLELTPDRCEDLIDVLRSMGVDRVHIHHLAGFPITVRSLVEALGKPFDFTVHDYFAICPQINMLPDPAGEHCNEPREAVCNACIAARRSFEASDIVSWRRRFEWLFLDADRVFCPDRDVRERLDRYGLAERAVIAPHQPPIVESWQPQHRPLAQGLPMRVAVLGVLAALKGLRVFENCVRMADPGSYKFIVIGSIDVNHLASDVRLRVEVTGSYKEADLPQLLEIHAPHVIWFPGLVPETYSYTLSSALAARMPLISSDIGAIPSRTRGRPWTLHVKPSLDPSGWLEAFGHMRKSMLSGVWVEPLDNPHDDCRTSILSRRSPLRRGRSEPILILPDRFSNGSPTPCGYIRLLLPYDDLASAGEARIDLIDAKDLAHVTGSVVIAQRHAAETMEAADEIIAACRVKGTRLIYDLDDNLAVDIPRWHPEFEFLTEMAPVVCRFLHSADIVTTSTPALANALASLCNRCVVLENTLDTRVWGELSEQVESVETRGGRRRPIRILYLGTATHDVEYQMLQPCFRELKAKYGEGLMIDILGMTNRLLEVDVNRITPPSSNYLALAGWLKSQPPWDIGLAPLVANPFNECKSQIKLLDYTALGLAVIASDEAAYRGEIAKVGGVLLVENNPKAWIAGMISLIESSKLRSEMCSAARRVVRSRFVTARRRHERAMLINRLIFPEGQV